MFDLLIQNGMVVDGTGNAPYRADVAVENGTIVAIEPHIDAGRARTVLDAAGLAVAPGFIDIHSHSDDEFLNDDRCESRIYQGVTTELMGQCGFSNYPCPEEHRARITEFVAPHVRPYAACSMAEYIENVSRAGKRMGTNLLPLVGHGALRCGVMSWDDRAPTEDELRRMRELLARDMRDGAWGMSLGLGYTPGVSSTTEELCALGCEVAPYGGIITAHMRNQSEHTDRSIEELSAIYRASGAHVHIAHFKAAEKACWGRAPEFTGYVRAAQQAGVHLTVDLYPYTAAASDITNSFPHWAIQGGKKRALARAAGPERARLIADISHEFTCLEDGDNLIVVSTYGKAPECDGKTARELALLWGVSAAEAVVIIAEKSEGEAACVSFLMSEEDVSYLLSQPDFCIGSDGRSFSIRPELNQGKPHPRNFATFPRFLRLVREQKLCDLQTAVRRITGLSADTIGLRDRGYVKPGLVADLTVFDPERIADQATFLDPFLPCVGIEHVVMGGALALQNGKQTALRAGQFLLKR